MVDEELAVEVIGLMLHTGAEIAFTFDAHSIAVKVETFEGHAAGTLHFGTQFRHREAAFVLFGELGIDDRDHGIDEHAEVLRGFRIVFLKGHVDNDDALKYADLGRGDAHAAHGVQGIEHILSDGADLVVDLSDGFALLGKDGYEELRAELNKRMD